MVTQEMPLSTGNRQAIPFVVARQSGVYGMATRGTSGACWVSLFLALLVLPASTAASAQQAGFMPSADPALARPEAAAPDESAPTRFIIGLERPVDFKVSALTRPNRVLVDLPQVRLFMPAPPGQTPVGVVKGFQYGVSAPGRLRVVIDVTEPVVVEKAAIEKSADGKLDRLVLDIAAVDELPNVHLQPPVPRPAVPPRKRAAGSYKSVIVIDPGHGGEDSGATKFGTVEKNVVLSFSLKLRDKLAATGFYKVLMTRDRDVFVPLDERRRFAERNQAALFIAIHADYTERASARGATIYSLRPYVAEALRRSAESGMRETVLSGKQVALARQADADVDALRGILAEKARDLIERNQIRTSVFAHSVINYVGSSTNLMENPDRNAAFVVLKTAKVPAILLELGYITNTKDAEQLNSDRWRDKVSASVVTAINNYMHVCIDMAQC
jgi:N-acetylmuramoyl-L-alanine amidase